ncbi:hypothetical protein H6S82_18320 [Planktothrix sp. FACHB-1355]|uniref:Uncharacterized protein n=1 Tax=Aerosakkonema funiforme FACHB-1375 TaxID=2949571 RepID=A0A926ZFK2_9CYAN|nr:hypothetical protein [Aerosakkonema funiforme FACHB-1375]MBD3560787.1 hypothetical protein [Planktothrix sp. FACHB-1355]
MFFETRLEEEARLIDVFLTFIALLATDGKIPMRELHKIFNLLRRTLFMVLLAGLISLISLPTLWAQAIPFMDNSSQPENMNRVGNRPYDERGNANIIQADKDSSLDNATVNRIQNKAEDLGNSQRGIGDTGLKNIKNLGKNIPQAIDRNFNHNPKDI